ncbi:MAG: hypothetical protein ABIG61_02205 [Planctomycetota bacterium]
MIGKSKIRPALLFLFCLPLCMLLMAVWHEVVGHCLTAILMGGRITLLDLFNVQIWPEFGKPGLPGRMDYVGAPGSRDIVNIAAPLSTWCVSVLAVILLWVRRWKGFMYVVLVCLSLWCYDIFTETLSIWGFPRAVWFHNWHPYFYRGEADHYKSAVNLGISSSLFIIFGIGTTVCLIAGLVIRLIIDHKATKAKDKKIEAI